MIGRMPVSFSTTVIQIFILAIKSASEKPSVSTSKTGGKSISSFFQYFRKCCACGRGSDLGLKK